MSSLLQGRSVNQCRTLLRVPTWEGYTSCQGSLLRVHPGGVNSLALGTEWPPSYGESPKKKANAGLGGLTGRHCQDESQRDVDGAPAILPDFLKPKDLNFCRSRSGSTLLPFSAFRKNLDVWTWTWQWSPCSSPKDSKSLASYITFQPIWNLKCYLFLLSDTL